MAVLYAESAPITSARKNRNIYQSARELKGLTQEAAAERLDISVESLGAYEQDRRRPPDSTVLKMARLYGLPCLCYQHIQSGDFKEVLPQVGSKTLEHATMRVIRLIGHFAKVGRLDDLLLISEDGIITAEEKPLYDAIMNELREIVKAALELDFCTKGSEGHALR